jgi:hypothetical protein
MRARFKQITAVQRSNGGHKIYGLDMNGDLWSMSSTPEGINIIGSWKKEPMPQVSDIEVADRVSEQTAD